MDDFSIFSQVFHLPGRPNVPHHLLSPICTPQRDASRFITFSIDRHCIPDYLQEDHSYQLPASIITTQTPRNENCGDINPFISSSLPQTRRRFPQYAVPGNITFSSLALAPSFVDHCLFQLHDPQFLTESRDRVYVMSNRSRHRQSD